jgi:hypothetical protein
MPKVRFNTQLRKFDKQGEKTGWTYFEIPADIASKIKPGNKKSFRVKGKLDNHSISGVAVLPMGGGTFIMPVNATLRKKLGKRNGAMLTVELTEDLAAFQFNKDFIACLSDEPAAREFFQTLPGSHQRYFSKWIDSAKTDITKANRIAQAVNGLARKLGYGEMLRALKGKL